VPPTDVPSILSRVISAPPAGPGKEPTNLPSDPAALYLVLVGTGVVTPQLCTTDPFRHYDGLWAGVGLLGPKSLTYAYAVSPNQGKDCDVTAVSLMPVGSCQWGCHSHCACCHCVLSAAMVVLTVQAECHCDIQLLLFLFFFWVLLLCAWWVTVVCAGRVQGLVAQRVRPLGDTSLDTVIDFMAGAMASAVTNADGQVGPHCP